jgi:hypothetical protein
MTALLHKGTDTTQRYAIFIDIIGSTTLSGPWSPRITLYYLTLIYVTISGLAQQATVYVFRSNLIRVSVGKQAVMLLYNETN